MTGTDVTRTGTDTGVWAQAPAAFAAAIPKVSLHLHLEGAVDAATVLALADRHGVPVPRNRDAAQLYDLEAHADLGEFLQTYDLVGAVIQDAADFHRVTYESLAAGAAHNVLYREMFVSVQAHPGVLYRTLLDGITAAIIDAEADFGITCRLIMAVNREKSPAEGLELVEAVAAHPSDYVLGIGLDYAEANGPPERFAEAFEAARKAGLHRTAHSESGPPANITTLLDVLHCERIDHGYHVLTDPVVIARCRDERVPFTCTPVTSAVTGVSRDLPGSHRTVASMAAAGLAVTIDSDDPPMFATDPTRDFTELAAAAGYSSAELLHFTDTAVKAAWLDESDRQSLRRRVDAAAGPLTDSGE